MTDKNPSKPEGKKNSLKEEKANLRYKKRQQKLLKLLKRRKNIKYKNDRNQSENNTNSFFKKLKNWWPLSKVSGKILLIYLFTLLIGGFLLSVPGVVLGKENSWNLMTGLFTAASAFSDTGITLLNTHESYSFIGQLIVIIMIQIGGIGILTVKILIYIILNKKISVNDQSVAQSERGGSNFSSTISTIKDGFIFLLIVEIVGASILFFAFYYTQTPADPSIGIYNNSLKSLWAAIFHSVSAVNNAGFDIISGQSLAPYNSGNTGSYMIQVIFVSQWVIGGIGYPTFSDIKKKIKARKEGKSVRFSLFTKLNFIVYTFLFFIGPSSVFLTELSSGHNSSIFYNHDENGNAFKKENISIFFDVFFNISSTRNAGFSSIDINNFNGASKMIMSILMFIGSAPSSTAGGIRTTTFAIIILAILSIIRNKKNVSAFKKTIPSDTVKRSFAVFALSIFIVVLAIIIMFSDLKNISKNNLTPNDTDGFIIKEILLITSAFGTVGFSPFGQEEMIAMGWVSKFTLILIMFIGQLGISNSLLAFIKPKNKENFVYLEEDVLVG